MATTRQVIAIAGAGDLGRYLCEETLKSPYFDVVILTRGTQRKWFTDLQIPIHTTDYTTASILSILDASNATTLISFINTPTPAYIDTHTALLSACTQSLTCKRLIPSEWIGDVESHPLKPDFYATTREPFRQILKAQSQVEWTLFNPGWLMDYFLPSEKTYMSPIAGLFPVDVEGWQACVRGTGDEGQSWTCARDVARAVLELCMAERWEQVTYVAGEWSTFHAAIKVIESHYGRSMPLSYKSREEIQHSLEAHANEDNMVEEMMVMGCLACPKAKTLRQREKYFGKMIFRDLGAFLRCAEGRGVA